MATFTCSPTKSGKGGDFPLVPYIREKKDRGHTLWGVREITPGGQRGLELNKINCFAVLTISTLKGDGGVVLFQSAEQKSRAFSKVEDSKESEAQESEEALS